MKVIRAAHLGMCFGVRDAIALALEHVKAAPLTILGDLVHNSIVLADLRANGIAIARDLAQVQTSSVMVTAHGASQRALQRTRALGLDVVEATCPLVHAAHRAVASLVREGYHLDSFDVVLDEQDVMELEEHPRIGIAAQTTQSIERVRHLVGLIRRRFPQSDVRFIDTVCKPTKLHQDAAGELARTCDVVVVIGGANSNNTRELVTTCSRYCSRVHHVQTELDLRPEWFVAAAMVGITAGTSTPDQVIDRIEGRVRELGARLDDGGSRGDWGAR
jgi:4-hydroxy-3-methylbut-2-enyl diphosphate reductase